MGKVDTKQVNEVLTKMYKGFMDDIEHDRKVIARGEGEWAKTQANTRMAYASGLAIAALMFERRYKEAVRTRINRK